MCKCNYGFSFHGSIAHAPSAYRFPQMYPDVKINFHLLKSTHKVYIFTIFEWFQWSDALIDGIDIGIGIKTRIFQMMYASHETKHWIVEEKCTRWKPKWFYFIQKNCRKAMIGCNLRFKSVFMYVFQKWFGSMIWFLCVCVFLWNATGTKYFLAQIPLSILNISMKE